VARKTRILDEFVAVTGFHRKHVPGRSIGLYGRCASTRVGGAGGRGHHHWRSGAAFRCTHVNVRLTVPSPMRHLKGATNYRPCGGSIASRRSRNRPSSSSASAAGFLRVLQCAGEAAKLGFLCIPTCCAMPPALSSPTTGSIGGSRSATRCATPSRRLRGSRTSGAAGEAVCSKVPGS
jgi:hypothetical protein